MSGQLTLVSCPLSKKAIPFSLKISPLCVQATNPFTPYVLDSLIRNTNCMDFAFKGKEPYGRTMSFHPPCSLLQVQVNKWQRITKLICTQLLSLTCPYLKAQEKKIHKEVLNFCINGNNNTLLVVHVTEWIQFLHLDTPALKRLLTGVSRVCPGLLANPTLATADGRSRTRIRSVPSRCQAWSEQVGLPSPHPSAAGSGAGWVPPADRLHTLESVRPQLMVPQFNPAELLGSSRLALHLWNSLPSLTHLSWNLSATAHHAKDTTSRSNELKACALGALAGWGGDVLQQAVALHRLPGQRSSCPSTKASSLPSPD